jgi:hypothetical protein
MLNTTVEIMPGEIWESIKGKHVGRRVEIIRDSGTSVKAKVLRGYGASSGDKHAGSVWSIERNTFKAMFRQVAPDNGKLKPVETDLGKLMEKMPKPLVVNPINLEREEAAIASEPKTEEQAAEDTAVEVADEVIERAIEKAAAAHDEKWQKKWESLHSPEAKVKRAETLQSRIDALTQDERDEMKRLRYEMHETVGEIARAYKLGFPETARLLLTMKPAVETAPIEEPGVPQEKPKAVRNFSAEGLANISKSAHAIANRQAAALTARQKQDIVDMYNSGVSFMELMGDNGLIAGALSRVLREGGVDISKKSRNARQAAAKRARRERKTETETEPVVAPPQERITYKVGVLVLEPVDRVIEISAVNIGEALTEAQASPGVVRVKVIREA